MRLLGAVHYCLRSRDEGSVKRKISLAVRAAIFDAQHRSGASISDSITTCHLAEALLMAGDVTGAEAVLQEAFAFVDQSGERLWLSDLHRVDGRIALKEREPDRARAEACISQSDRDRKEPRCAPARTARCDRPSRPPVARRGSRPMQSSVTAGADPRLDRGRGEREGRPQRPRVDGGDRNSTKASRSGQGGRPRPSLGPPANALSAERLHGDDTTVPILAKGKTETGRVWTYVRDDRPFGGNDPPAALFYASRPASCEGSRVLRW